MFDREVNLTNQSIGADEYLWELGDGYSSSDLQFNHTYADTGTFVISLTVSTVNGCEDVSSTVFVIPPTINFGVPNAFTPDGDGLNDTFFFTGFGIMDQDFEFQVFNRWGELVYNTTAFQPWDGTYNGTPARDGVYAYRIRYRDTLGATTTKQGHVTLLR
jgi:gliding motility-associated-like protein